MQKFVATLQRKFGHKPEIVSCSLIPPKSSWHEKVTEISGSMYEHTVDIDNKLRSLYQVNSFRDGFNLTATVVVEGETNDEARGVIEKLLNVLG